MKKIFVLILAALLVMSSMVLADPTPTIVGTACTSDSQCPSGQTCRDCPSGLTCTSAKICLAAAGTTPEVAASPFDDFPLGSSVIELCRYSKGPYGTTAGRGDREPRSNAKYAVNWIQRDRYTFEATDIKSDGTVTLKITKDEGLTPKYEPSPLTLSGTTGTVTFGPAGQEIKLIKNPGITEHQYIERNLNSIGYNRMDGKCASFLVAPSSWENINLPYDTPFGSVANIERGSPAVWFKNGERLSVFGTGSSETATTTTVTVGRVRENIAQDTLNLGESKVIGPFRIKYEGNRRDRSLWVAALVISDKDAQVVAAPAAVAQAAPAASLSAGTSLQAALPSVSMGAALPPKTKFQAKQPELKPMERVTDRDVAGSKFRYSEYTCQDGTLNFDAGNGCAPLGEWYAKAKKFCNDHNGLEDFKVFKASACVPGGLADSRTATEEQPAAAREGILTATPAVKAPDTIAVNPIAKKSWFGRILGRWWSVP